MKLAPPPRFWFLPATAAVALFLGLSAFHAEEDPNDQFVYDRTESVLYLYLDAPGGTSLDSNSSPAAIGVLLERYSWEIWRQSSTGIEQYQNAQVTPESGAMVSLTRSPEAGSLADSTLVTGSDGRAWTTFSPAGYSGGVTIQASAGESTASLSFDISTTYSSGWEEQWSFSHTEATLTASLVSTVSTYDVPPGESRELSLSVSYETWDVEVSSFGNTRIENRSSAPASGASVSWMVEMGDGYVTGFGQTDALGQCPATLTVGASSGNVRAEVSFSTGSATSATLAFSPSYSSPPTPDWYQIGSIITPSITGLSPTGGTSLAPGQFIQISGTLQGDVWDLWSNGTQEESRYSYTTPLAWTSLLAEISQGGGSLDSSYPSTQWDGWFSSGYTMGYSSSRLDLRLASTNELLASLDFALSEEPPATGGPDPSSWTPWYSDSGYAIQNLTVDGPTYDLLPGDARTIGGTLYWVTWDVGMNGHDTLENRITSSSPAPWSSLSATVEYGDGTVSSMALTTGSLGEFSTTLTMGAAESKVTFSTMSSPFAPPSIVFTPPQAVEDQGVKISEESVISVAFESDPNASNTTLLPGQSIPLRARVLSTSWEVWQLLDGSTVLRNHATRPAIGAVVNFSQVSGPGSLSSWQVETDADGIASVDFMLGEGISLIRADASFFTATAVAEVQVSPEIWVYDSSQDELELSLSLHGPSEAPNAIGATLQVRSTEIWRNLANNNTEPRQVSYSPAENASIVFSALDGGIATFGANPTSTDYTGNAIMEYRSNGAVNIAATATFSGKTITATMQAPRGWGLAGTDGGGTDGSGTDGGGNVVNGIDDSGNTETTGGGENTSPPTPSQPMPNLHLRGRKHETNDPESETNEGGSSTPTNRVEIFRVKFSRPTSGQGDEPQEPDKEVIGRRETWNAVRDEHFHTNPPWEIVEGPFFEFVEETELLGGNSSTTYHDYVVRGRMAPESEIGDLKLIKNANEVRQLVEAGNFIPDAEVNGAFSASFAENPWDQTIRETAAGRTEIQSPEPTASASYLGGSVPSVVWTEYWLEAEDDVPASGPSAKHTVHFMARKRETGKPTKHWFGSATLEISNASGSNSKRVSTTKPVVTWSDPDASPPTNWVVAEPSGVLRFQPEVMRDAVNEILPVELISDLNNDGGITSADNALRDAALKSGASEENKKKGTEFLFINDKMSNGVWDADDDGVMTYSYGSGYGKMPKPPASHKADDDAEPLKVSVGGLNTGIVWFDHPAIDKLEFFDTRECLPGDKLNLTSASPFDLNADTLPETIYVRLRDDWAGTDQEGNLRMFIGKSTTEIWGELQLPLTVVRDFGSKHFFHAARDYILENNARVCIRDHGYPSGPDPSIIFRLCIMREEATTMSPVISNPSPGSLGGSAPGIQGAYSRITSSSPAVLINGNQCFFSSGLRENVIDSLQTEGKIADKCHGRVIRGGITSGISSDNFDVMTKPAAGSPLAGPDPIPAGTLAGSDGVLGTADDIANPYADDPGGKYLSCNSGAWTFAAGRAGGSDALGGLSTNYESDDRVNTEHQMIGYAKGDETGKGCIFTATQIKGVGYGPIFKNDASVAGVPPLSPSVDARAIKLFILDCGFGSLALMHIDPTGTMRGAYMGRKTNFGYPYYVNNYLALDPAPPRP